MIKRKYIPLHCKPGHIVFAIVKVDTVVVYWHIDVYFSYCVSQNTPHLACYNFSVRLPMLIVFG